MGCLVQGPENQRDWAISVYLTGRTLCLKRSYMKFQTLSTSLPFLGKGSWGKVLGEKKLHRAKFVRRGQSVARSTWNFESLHTSGFSYVDFLIRKLAWSGPLATDCKMVPHLCHAECSSKNVAPNVRMTYQNVSISWNEHDFTIACKTQPSMLV